MSCWIAMLLFVFTTLLLIYLFFLEILLFWWKLSSNIWRKMKGFWFFSTSSQENITRKNHTFFYWMGTSFTIGYETIEITRKNHRFTDFFLLNGKALIQLAHIITSMYDKGRHLLLQYYKCIRLRLLVTYSWIVGLLVRKQWWLFVGVQVNYLSSSSMFL